MNKTPSELLKFWLQRQLPASAWQWLDAELGQLAQNPSDRQLSITLGMIPRRLGKADLDLTGDDSATAETARSGWKPHYWSIDNAARILALDLVARDGSGSNISFDKRFEDLCRYADVAELIALYRGLALYPAPQTLELQAAEGLRTNMRAVFEAIAHHNPYPREQFDQNRWNQMVLKALFIGSSLWPIQGLDERSNPELARILCDYVHERRAAGRPIAVELWRCIGPFAEGAMLDDLAQELRTGSAIERQAAVLALSASPDPNAAVLLQTVPELAAPVSTGAVNWDSFSQSIH
jgi:hypothetical protein